MAARITTSKKINKNYTHLNQFFCSLYIIHTEQTLYANQFIIKVQVLSSFSFLSFVVYYVCLSGIFTQRHTIAETSLRESTHCWSFVHNPHSVSLWSYSFLLYQHECSIKIPTGPWFVYRCKPLRVVSSIGMQFAISYFGIQ